MKKLFVLLALAGTAGAATVHYDIDETHASVGFTIKHMMVSNVAGSFAGVKGSVDVDPADPTTAKVTAEIDAKSINTGNGKRDDHLRAPDFFDVAKFPSLTYVSKKVEKNGDKYKMTGDLTMHGVTKEVVLDVEPPTEAIKDPWGNTRRGISATGKLSRKEWGLTYGKVMEGGGLMLGDEVKLSLDLELIEAKPKDASPAPSPEK